jgi:hypothetical protein
VPAVVDSRDEKEGECTTPGARVMRAMKSNNRISGAGRATERRNIVQNKEQPLQNYSTE